MGFRASVQMPLSVFPTRVSSARSIAPPAPITGVADSETLRAFLHWAILFGRVGFPTRLSTLRDPTGELDVTETESRPRNRALVASFLFTDIVGYSKGTASEQYAAKAALSDILGRN